MTFFSIIGSIIFFLFNLYSYKSLCKNALFKRLNVVLLFIFTLLFSCELAFFFHWTSSNSMAYSLSVYAIGFSFMAFCVLGLGDLLGAFFASRKNKSRQNIRMVYDTLVLCLLVCYIGFGAYNASTLKVKERNIEIAGLEKSLRAVMISDVHLGNFLGLKHAQKVVELINKENPEMVFIVGDFIDTKAYRLGDIAEPFKNLKAQAFFVSGNHEFYHGIEGIFEKIAELGIKIIDNSSVELESINIAGLSDLQGANFGMEPNPLKALADINRSKPTILLSHQPKSLSLLSFDELNNISLVLSGHTHAGQIFPFSLLVWAAQGYIYGESDITPRTKLVVSSGAGFWGPPMRILSNNEIVVLNLIPRAPK